MLRSHYNIYEIITSQAGFPQVRAQGPSVRPDVPRWERAIRLTFRTRASFSGSRRGIAGDRYRHRWNPTKPAPPATSAARRSCVSTHRRPPWSSRHEATPWPGSSWCSVEEISHNSGRRVGVMRSANVVADPKDAQEPLRWRCDNPARLAKVNRGTKTRKAVAMAAAGKTSSFTGRLVAFAPG